MNKQFAIPPRTEEHLLAHPEVMGLLEEARTLITDEDANSDFALSLVDFGRVIGTNNCVIDHESRMFAYRVGRNAPTRVTITKQGTPCSTMVVIHMPDKMDTTKRFLITAFIGTLAEKEPHDKSIQTNDELKKALEFWSSHAIVWDPTTMGKNFTSSWKEILT